MPVEGTDTHILTNCVVEQTVCVTNPWRCDQIIEER